MGDTRRFPRPSGSRPFAVGVGIPGPAPIVRNRPSYASAISDCWNNTNSTSPTPSTSASARQGASSLAELKTTCLFCPNIVIVPNPSIREPPGVLGRRNKLLKNLCFHLQVNAKELPKEGTKAMFPFCINCDKNVKELMDSHEEMERIKGKIAQTVANIERIVADREILGKKGPPSPIENQKFVKLYDMILEGYRNKLILRQQQNNSLVLNNKSCPTPASYSPVGIRNGGAARRSGGTISPSPGPSGGLPKQEYDGVEILEDLTVHMDPLDVGAEIEVGEVPNNGNFNSPSSPDIMEGEEEQSYEDFEDESSVYDNGNLWNNMEEQEEEENLGYNENGNCNLVISNVQSTAAASRGGNRGEVIDVATVKQEMMAQEEESEEEVEGDGTSEAVYAVAERKRRLLFEGIEIIKCYGTRSRKDEEYLQCSDCTFTLAIPKLSRREAKANDDMSPYMKMKLHIQNVHKKIPGPVKPRAPPQFTCGYCDILFPNLASLREHNKTQPHPKFLPCDTCARPIKGGHFNLLLHKFSHKNDEERLISLANNERGSYHAFLSSKLTSVYMRKLKKQQMEARLREVEGEAGASPSPSSSAAAAVAVATSSSPSATGRRAGPRSKKRSRTSRGGASKAKPKSPSATVTSTTTAPVPIPTPSPARDRATSRARNRSEVVAVAKPFGCRICNKYFSQKNHLSLHMKTHSFRRSERRRGSQQNIGDEEHQEEEQEEDVEERVDVEETAEDERNEEPRPSTSASSIAEISSEIEAIEPEPGTSSGRRRVEMVTADLGPPPLLSPQDTVALARNLESTIGEVCDQMGISVGELGVGEGGDEEVVNGEADDGDDLEAPILKREVT